MPAEFESILPNNSTAWEKVIEQASGERWAQLDVDVIRRFKDPAACPEHLLNFLAFELSIDIWNDAWPVEVKRSVIADWYNLHRYKGTEYGVRRHVQIAGGRVVKIVTAPQRALYDQGLTPAERQAWLDLMPQLRIYPYYARGLINGPIMAWHGRRRIAWSRNAWNATIVRERYRRFARLYEPRTGEQTDLSYTQIVRSTFLGQAVEFDQLVLPPENNGAFYLGHKAWTRSAWGRPNIAERTFRFAIDRPYEFSRAQVQDRTVRPGFDPVTVNPEHVYERGTGPHVAMFWGNRRWASLTGRNTAWRRVYERTYLHDRARSVPIRHGRAFWGHMRYGIKPYTAEVTVDVGRKLAGRYQRSWYGGFWQRKNTDKLDGVLAAVRSAKALRDKILVQSKTRRPLTFADRPRFGEFAFGDKVSTAR